LLGPQDPETPLIGRCAELSELLLTLARGAKGEGSLVTLEGEAGIGKTFLLEQALSKAEALGFRCFAGGAEELERHRPFGAISEALGIGRRGRIDQPPLPGEDERRAAVAQLLAEPAGPVASNQTSAAAMLAGAQPEGEFRVVDALIDFIEHLCAGGPVVVALEDLQWSDPSTLLALNHLGREIPRLPAVLIATMRPLPRSPELQSFLNELSAGDGQRQMLGKLADESVARLVETILGAAPGPRLLAQVRRAAGNPFFATELVAALQREGAINVRDGTAEVDAPTLPSSLASAIRRRLSFLSEEEVATLQVASILGSKFSMADLATVSDRPPATLAPHVTAAEEAGILHSEGHLFTFHHDLIRAALYAGMAQPVRNALHQSAARALEEAGLPPEDVAEHVVRGAVPGDLGAVEWLRTAARQAEARSPTIAADLLQRALDILLSGAAAGLPEGAEGLRDATLADLASSFLSSGHLGEAEKICRSTLEREHDPKVDGTLRLCLVQIYVGQGRVGKSLLAIEEAVRSPALTERERGRLWAWSSTCRVIIWDLEGAAASAERALAVCGQIEDDLGTTVARAGLAALENLRGNFSEALRLAEEALAGARRSRSPEARRLQLTLMHTLLLIDVDRVDDAQLALRRGREARERRGARWNLAPYHFVSCIGRFWSGEWDEAIAQFDSAMDFAEEVVVGQGEVVGHAVRSMIALHRGELATADREATAAEEDSQTSGPQWRANWMLWARALVTEAQGQEDAALRLLTKGWEQCSGAGVVAEYPVIGPDLVRMAIAGGERLLAEEVTVAVETLAATAEVPSVKGAALRCRGLLDSNPAALLEAVAAYRLCPRKRELALACEDAAVALIAAGRCTDARPLADEALGTYRSFDAQRDVSRALRRLRGFGQGEAATEEIAKGRTDRSKPGSGSGGWESLTRAEAKMADLVAKGLSNPEIARRLFISRRTVQSHVSHALEKLGLSSRVELAVARSSWNARGGDGLPPTEKPPVSDA
jgi:DNA-binding CsgD family transcriptional regulator